MACSWAMCAWLGHIGAGGSWYEPNPPGHHDPTKTAPVMSCGAQKKYVELRYYST